MEAERQKYEYTETRDAKGTVSETAAHPVGPVQKFEFGMPDDAITEIVGGGYFSSWNPDFLQKDMGKTGTINRFYYDRRIAVDIGDPEDKISRRKRKLLFRHAFGYMCIPIGFPQDKKRLKKLYEAAVDEYFQYEKIHPRPSVLHEVTLTDKDGTIRQALVTAIQVKVGGGFTASVEQQQQELKSAQKLTKKEVKAIKLQAKMHRKLRKAAQTGTPFRNPFVTKTKRKYPIQYAS